MRATNVYLVYIILFSALASMANQNAGEDISQRNLGDFNYFESSLSLEGRYFEEITIDKATLIGPHLSLKGSLFLAKNQSFDFHVKFIQEFGSSQSRFGENLPVNGFFVDQGFYSFKPSRWKIDLGLINQSWLKNELLFEDVPFPSLRVSYNSTDNDDLSYHIFGQISIPTTSEIKTRTQENENDPFSAVSGFSVGYEEEKWKLELRAYYYTLRNLPSEIAIESDNLGNSVTVITADKEAIFDKSFEGIAGSVHYEQALGSDLRLLLDWQLIENKRVETGFGEGQMLKAGFSYSFFGQKQSLRYVDFFNESDTSVASYNSYRIGHNNRDGQGGILQHNFHENSMIQLTYLESDVIDATFTQNEIRFIHLSNTWTF